MEALKGERTKHLRNLTRLKNDILTLRAEPKLKEAKTSEKLELYDRTFGEFSKAHEAYVAELNETDAKDENSDYYQPKAEEYRQFSDETSEWLKAREDEVHPDDSVSNCSKTSKLSSVASTVRMEEEARLEELKAKAELLRGGRDLEEKERLLQQQKEDYELEMEIKMAEAKANVYKKYENPAHPEQRREENTPSEGMRDLIRSQTEISKMMIDQHKLASLPRRELQVFDGKVQDYRSFVTAFEHNIERLTDNDRDRLYYLQQYTSGRARELVRSCMGKDLAGGYALARQELEEEYGDEFKILSSFRKDIELMQPIKGDNASSWKDYLTFCVVFGNTIDESDTLRRMEQTENIMNLVGKLPYRMRESWRRKAYRIKEATNHLARLKDYVNFVREQVNICTDSVYGEIRSESPRESTRPGQGRRTKGFSTVVQEERPGAKKPKCLFCDGNHTLDVCRGLGSKTHDEKLRFLRSKGLCFRCSEADHLSRNCTQEKLVCKTCKMRHPTVLHYARTPGGNPGMPTRGNWSHTSQDTTSILTSCVNTQPAGEATICMGAGVNKTSLPIVPVRVWSRMTNKEVETYAFLDSGSTDTFVSKKLARQLCVKGPKTKIVLNTLPNREDLVHSQAINKLDVKDLLGHTAISLPTVYVTERIPVAKEDIVTQDQLTRWPYLGRVQLPNIEAQEVGLLIGNNAPKAMEPWEVINSQGDGPYAIRTCLGWTVNGPVISTNKASVNLINLQTIDEMLTSQFNHDFSERVSEEKLEKSRDDNLFLNRLESTTRMVNGHYETGLPLRREGSPMPNNKDLAVRWATNMKRRLQKDPRYLEDYKVFMQSLLEKGYATPIPEEELHRDDGKVWYVPHHGVYHPQKKKIRVVFNCAAKFRGTSLNDSLLQGPDLTNSLVGVLQRFRLEPIALMADIEAMFYQVRVQKDQCDFMRFLWWPDGNTDGPMREYRMTVHLFGAVSSPSCANYALHKTANDFGEEYNRGTVDTVKENFYVDDMLKSVKNEVEAVTLMRELRELLGKGGFNLTKWVSNSRVVLDAIPEGKRAEGIRSLQMDVEQLPVDRALGVMWCVESDQFQFRVTVNERPYTRKGILSIVASVYDPLGFLAPFTLVAKKILQDLCKRKVAWDDDIPDEHLKCWKRWLMDLPKLQGFKVDRCLKPDGFGNLKETQLHVFSDASESGYGVVTYVRLTNEDGRSHCAFVTGKARVAPLKQVTVPRLELTAAAVAAKLSKTLERDLHLKPDKVKFWTDSTAVLRYISNTSARYHTFVANRIATITDVSHPSQWSYVESSENPADDASRGLYADELIRCHRWITGPDFLWLSEEEWPSREQTEQQLPLDDPEVKRKVTVAATSTTMAQSTMNDWISKYSSWFKLRRHTAWMLKLMSVLQQLSCLRKSLNGRSSEEIEGEMERARQRKTTVKLSVSDLEEAELTIVKFVQNQAFHDEIAALTDDPTGRPIKKSSPIHRLDPKFENGVLRVGGRLGRSAMPEDEKHQYILPKDSIVSQMIIREIHERVHHGGRAITLSQLRRKYWVVSANALVRKCINQCVACRRLRPKTGEQRMADLPTSRITPDEPPFTRVGVDFFGPFEIKQGRSMVKRYGVIFTCFCDTGSAPGGCTFPRYGLLRQCSSQIRVPTRPSQ